MRMRTMYWLDIVLIGGIVLAASSHDGQCVNLDKYDRLAKEDLLKLDRQVSSYYYDNYATLDDKNVTYDEQLFSSIRAIRHTNVQNLFDYIYTNESIMRQSAGKQVNLGKCRTQLATLNYFALNYFKQQPGGLTTTTIPLSVINFLESSGRPESGILNGNFVWLGSFSSCEHARIASRHARLADPSYAQSEYEANLATNDSSSDIVGRFCVAHLRAKSWPRDDLYFGNRITIKLGLCLPSSCHTSSYTDSAEVRASIESLGKLNLVAPFDGDRYEINYLYCLPDEDSPFRQWDLGTKLFIVFVAIWLMLLLYSNIKYQTRLRAIKRLNESVDIRMVIEQSADDGMTSVRRESLNRIAASNQNSLKPPAPAAGRRRAEDGGGGGGSGQSSADVSPMASDVDEADGEFRPMRTVLLTKHAAKRTKPAQGGALSASRQMDFVRAFSVKANIDHLFQRGSNAAQGSAATGNKLAAKNAPPFQQQLASQLASTRRQADRSESFDSPSSQSAAEKPPKRVNIDILDGVKVFATCYIVYGHTMMFFFGVLHDIRFGDERMFDFTMIATINGLQVVGLFYIITGVFITYLAFSRQKVEQLLQLSFWILVVVGRYLRLLPVYLLVFWFVRHVSPFTGSGPLWQDYRTDELHSRGFCATESWMTMLTMSAADIKIPLDCIPQSWYLSNDFRTLLILPFYIIILALNQTAGYAAIFSTLIYSTFRLTSVLREANIDYKILLYWQPHVYAILADRLHHVYTNLSVRLSTYLLGVIVGHILYLYEIGHIKRIPRWFKRFGLKAALLIGSISFMGAPLLASSYVNRFLPSADEIDSDTIVMLFPIFKSAMELCICACLLSLTTGGGFKWLTELLSSQPIKVLSNISYGVFLIHIEVMYKIPATKLHSSYWYLFLYANFFIILSNLIAFFIHILYEIPINNISRHMFKKIYQTVVVG